MGTRFSCALPALLLLAAAVVTAGQAPPADAASPSSDEALAWDRDFDLLLELKKIPTKAQNEAEIRRATLLAERESLQQSLADLKFRLSAVEGTYTTEAILNEMLRQGTGDMQAAQENLRAWIKRDEARMKETDVQLHRLAAGRVR